MTSGPSQVPIGRSAIGHVGAGVHERREHSRPCPGGMVKFLVHPLDCAPRSGVGLCPVAIRSSEQKRVTMLRTVGTILLLIGFVTLAGAWAINDPHAPDANIGAGILILIGYPVGAVGIVLLLLDLGTTLWRRNKPVRRRDGKSSPIRARAATLKSPALEYHSPVPARGYSGAAPRLGRHS